jgi:hypothetical protein
LLPSAADYVEELAERRDMRDGTSHLDVRQRPPSATRRRTIPSPIPLAPPVTTPTLPSNLIGTRLPASLRLVHSSPVYIAQCIPMSIY